MTIHQNRGFSLIELLITIAIVGIIAAVAIPSYQSSVDRSKRSQGGDYLLKLASAQELFYFAYGRYTDVIEGPVGCADADCGLNMVDTSDPNGDVNRGWYTAEITLDTESGEAYRITATPNNWTDSLCGNLTYNNQEKKGSSTGAVAECWR